MHPGADAPTEARSDSEGEAPPRGSSAGWRWLRRLLVTIGLVVVAALVFVFALVWPFVRDDLVLDRMVLAVALDWRDFGRDKAQARLEYELDHEGIGLQVVDESCLLEERSSGERVVACRWTASVELPFVAWRVPLAFQSRAEVAPDGSLR